MHNEFQCNYRSTRRKLKRCGVSERTIRFLFRDRIRLGCLSPGNVLVIGANAAVLEAIRFTRDNLSWLNDHLQLARLQYWAIEAPLLTKKLTLTGPALDISTKWFAEFGYALTTQVSRVTTHLPDRLQRLSLALENHDPNTRPYVEDCIAQLTESAMNSVLATVSLIVSGNEGLAVYMYGVDLDTEKLTKAGKFKLTEWDTRLLNGGTKLNDFIDKRIALGDMQIS